MVVDRRMIHRRLRELQGYVDLLTRAAALPRAPLLADDLQLFGVLYALQCAVESVTAVGHHLIAECNLGVPEKNPDVATILARAGILSDAGLIERLPRMVRFRNLLVHRYWQIDPQVVGSILDENLGDFGLFARSVETWLARQPDA
jgi:uncharacterized protein YutE (UPF0331/DUF86 family)